jgi:hypothetical protein
MPRYGSEGITGCGRAARLGGLLLGLIWGLAGAASGGESPVPAGYGEAPVWSYTSPLGAIQYRAGRGLHLGRAGLNVGGFSSFELVRDEGEATTIALEGINLLLLYEPRSWLRGFVEMEAGPIFEYDTDGDDLRFQPTIELERFYLDLERNDQLKVRVGRFRTPIGRWNLVPAEPFVWTANDPVFLQRAFADRETGGMLFGSLYPSGGTLSYWLYGQVGNPFADEIEPVTPDHNIGGRIEYSAARGEWSLGASTLATESDGDWSYLGGLDGEWHLGPVTLIGEFTAADGEIAELDLWGGYLQAVVEAVPTFYLVGRYEHFEPSGPERAVDLEDAGIAWIPRPWLQLKATYRFADHESDDVTRGLTASLSVLF